VTLKRLDLAFKAFFRRVKEGAEEVWVCGNAGSGGGAGDARGRPEVNRSGTDLGSCKRA